MTPLEKLHRIIGKAVGSKYVASQALAGQRVIEALTAAGYSIVHDSEIHGATKERCAAAVDGQKLTDSTGTADDIAYDVAITHAAHAIRALPDRGVAVDIGHD